MSETLDNTIKVLKKVIEDKSILTEVREACSQAISILKAINQAGSELPEKKEEYREDESLYTKVTISHIKNLEVKSSNQMHDIAKIGYAKKNMEIAELKEEIKEQKKIFDKCVFDWNIDLRRMADWRDKEQDENTKLKQEIEELKDILTNGIGDC